MTIYRCSSCGNAHDSSEPACPTTTIIWSGPDPVSVDDIGRTIGRLLLSIRDPEDRTGDRAAPESFDRHAHHHGTDSLRARALAVAGVCFLNPFEMASEGCGCPWSEEDPEGSMRLWTGRQEQIDRDLEELADWRIGIRLHPKAHLCTSCRTTVPGMGQAGGPPDPRA